eukprot:s3855_g3.t2
MLQGGMADVISFNAALSACVSRSDFAFQIFQEMEIRQVVPDRVSFNAMLSAAGQWEQVLNLLGKMRHSRYEADHISCSAAVLGCVRSQCWEVALSIFFDLARGADVVAWNSVLKAAPNWVMAVALLQQMRKVYLQPDLVACSTAISRCAEETDEFSWQVALRLLRLSEDRNEVTYGAAVTVMAKSAQWQQAMALLAEAEERRCLGTGTVNAAINACEQALRWQLAIVLLESLLEGPPYPDEISYCATIGACAAATQWAKALELSKDFTSAATLGAAMVACEVRGAWQHALAILQQMQHSSLEVSDLTFRAAMGACHSTVAMRWERSVDLLQRMQCAGLPPATLSHNFAITAIGRGMEWALALTAFRTVKHKLTAASGTFATTSSACDRGLQWAQTLELLRISNSEGLQSSMMIYGSSISAQEKVSHWRIGLGLLRSLRRQGLEAELVTCNSEEPSVTVAPARSQSAPPKRVVFNDEVDIPALEQQYKDKQMNRQVAMLQKRSKLSSLKSQTHFEAPSSSQHSEFEVGFSRGSYGHPTICQRRCILFVKGNCDAGANCNFCHLTHEMTTPSLDKHTRDYLKSLHRVRFMEMILPYVRKHAEESDLPGAECVLQMLQSEIAIRSFSNRSKPPPPQKTDNRTTIVLKRMNLAALVSLLCSVMSESRFPKFVSAELKKLRHTAKTLKALSACEKGSIWAWALELISQEMLHKDVCCDEISFNAAIGACRENWCTAGLCLEAMQSQRLTPDVVTCGLLIRSEARFAWSPGELRAVTSQSLRDGPPRRQVESLELLEAIDGLADAAISSFKAATYQPSVYPALRELILKPAESGQGTHKKTPDVLHCVCVSV